MKPQDRVYPTIDQYYQLQLQPVVAESYPQQRWNRSNADFVIRGVSLIQQAIGSAEARRRRH